MVRPIVGISAYAEQARWGEAWDLPATLLPQAYVDSVAASGAAPVLLPPVQGTAAAVTRLDALVLAGGGDIDPGRYGSPTGPHTSGVQPARDTAEIDLLTAPEFRLRLENMLGRPCPIVVDLSSVEDPFMVPLEEGCRIVPRAGVVSGPITGRRLNTSCLLALTYAPVFGSRSNSLSSFPC